MKDTFGKHNTRKSDINIDHYKYLLGLKAELRGIKQTHISITGTPDMVAYYLSKAIEYVQSGMDEIVTRSMDN